MKQLVLIRHGETDFTSRELFCGTSNPSLNKQGRTQSIALGNLLRSHSIDLCLASPLDRAIQTAELLQLNLPIHSEPLSREIGFGIFEGLSREICQNRFPSEWQAWCEGSIPPEGESVQSFHTRLTQLAENLSHEKSDTVLLVTHGGVIRLLLSHYLTGSFENQWRFKITPGSLCRIGFDGSFAYLESLQEVLI